jgi:signal transduction histidine kinase
MMELRERLVGQLLSESQSLMSLTSALARSSSESRAQTRRQSYWITVVLVGVTAVGIGVSLLLLSGAITRPIRRLHQGAELLANGQLDYKIGNASRDEVGELARAFDGMAESLRRRAAERDGALTSLRLDEERLETLLQLSQMTAESLKQLTDFALEAAVALTESEIGYLAFLNEDETVLTMHSWSHQAMKECAIIDKPIVYPVEKTGLWGEAVRQRKAIITNDYTAPNPLKKGHPEGHVPVRRHMNTPIFDGNKIVAVAGVGNKATPYNEADARQLTLLMQGMWRLMERRRAEEELRRHRDNLEELVQERTNELQTANEHLREMTDALARSNAELEQFAYIASHDLREPLRMVTSFVQMLHRRYHDKLDKDANSYIGFAVDGAQRMEQLIIDLLQYARVGTRGKELVPVDCNKIVQTVLQDLNIAIHESHTTVSINGSLPTVQGDDVQLTQLFQNLIANAIKFRKPDEPPRIEISASRNEHEWTFNVRDNGIGIEPGFFEKIFVIFQRLHARDKYPGTGIGLAVCKRIVERHGGRIWVESEPGHGSIFHFTLRSN